ncbi:DUF4012 domain-containing protein [Candidatus Woesebacteria bacterium]|nr:MAG: DUF4012 domain-containing protein [Candidatus Woesebacteria bacterium]
MIKIKNKFFGKGENTTSDTETVSDSVLIPKLGGEKNVNFQEPENAVAKKVSTRKVPKWLKIVMLITVIIFVISVIFSAVAGLMIYRVYQSGLETKVQVEKLVSTLSSQDINVIESELANTKTQVEKLKTSYGAITWMGALPYAGNYVNDGLHGLNAAGEGLNAAQIVIETVKPYADIIGLTKGSTDALNAEESAQDRLDFVVNTIPDVVPRASELSAKMEIIQNELSYIDPNRYPEEFRGIVVRANIKKGKELVSLGEKVITSGKPLLEVAPAMLGTNEPRTYLVLFQNDKELRPTGGFLTAYSIATVENGKFKPVSSSDIYNLDSNYKPSVPAPDPIRKYLKGPYILSSNFRIRDINWSPDFQESMELFVNEAKKAGIEDIDGVIAVDTEVLVKILNVIGLIGVPGFGNFSSEIDERCNCPNVVYELESFADVEGAIVWDQNDPTKIIFAPPNYENRKKIIGPLMNSVLSNSLGQSKEKIPSLFEAGFDSLLEKHVLFYMLDENEQRAVDAFGIAGTIDRDFQGDYLHINDANLGGRKSNLYVTQHVEQDIEIARDKTVTKTVTITYANPEKHDGWLNSVLPNWVRIYVPKGSTVVDVSGLDDQQDPYEEFDKTVVSGLFSLRPEGVAKVVVTYTLPFKADGEKYPFLIQKQPGTNSPLYSITINNNIEEFYLKTDKELALEL